MDNSVSLENRPFRPRLANFLKQDIPSGAPLHAVQTAIKNYHLNTVCEEAKCPNRTHCYGRGILTFQILGNLCTRTCGFCAEEFSPAGQPVDKEEPRRITEAAKKLRLRHVVITSPARDDLFDQGAGQFAHVVKQFRTDLPQVTVEILTPDFQGREDCLTAVFESRPDIFNHNIETVRRLTPKVRSKATYDRTLFVLKAAKDFGLTVKSGLMVGHGETKEELVETFRDLYQAGCTILTIGQYLRPSVHHLPLEGLYSPGEFDELRQEALQCGFQNVVAGPLVRSSYHAEETLNAVMSPGS